jgi:hypothetical protein
MLAHSFRDIAGMRRSQNNVVLQMMESEEGARGGASNEDEQEGQGEFPFQRTVHCENSV